MKQLTIVTLNLRIWTPGSHAMPLSHMLAILKETTHLLVFAESLFLSLGYLDIYKAVQGAARK